MQTLLSTLSNTSQDLREQADHVQQALTNRFFIIIIIISKIIIIIIITSKIMQNVRSFCQKKLLHL